MKFLFLFLFIIVNSSLLFSQSEDSTDRAYYKKYNELAVRALRYAMWNDAIAYADTICIKSKRDNNPLRISIGLILKGEAYTQKRAFSNAYQCYIEASYIVNNNEYKGNWKGRLYKDLFILFSIQNNQDSVQKYKDIILNLPCEKTNLLAKESVSKQLLSSNNSKEALVWVLNNTVCAKQLGAQSMVLNNLRLLGYIYQETKDYNKAIFYIDSTLKVAKELKDTLYICGAYYDLGRINSNLKNYSKALDWHRKSVEIIEQKNNRQDFHFSSNLVRLKIPMGPFYDALASAYQEVDTQNGATYYEDSIIFYRQKGLQLSYIQKDTFYIASSLINIARYIMNKEEKYDAALDSLDKAYNISPRYNYWELTQYQIYIAQGEIYTKKKQYNKAKKSLDKAELVAHLLSDTTSLLIDVYELNKSLYLTKEDYKKAYSYEVKTNALYKKQQEENRQKTLTDFEIKYGTEQIKQQNIVLAQERNIQELKAEQNQQKADRNQQFVYAAIVFVIFIIIIFILLISQFQTRAFLSTQKLKYQLLRNQMNPHFIFNSLEAIQSFVYKKKPLEAGEYIASFAVLMRAILDNSHEEYVSLSEEVRWLENYLKLQLLRFGSRFDYTLVIDPQIDTNDTMIPPMLTQPFIENALEHGLRNIDYKGHLNIEVGVHNDSLEISILDNGIGLEESQKNNENKEYESRAIAITQERLNFLNKKQTQKINLRIEPNEGKGTKISFFVPFISRF